MKRGWDILCSVVDNFGDAGVCWRLARQLCSELDQSVRFWVDNLDTLHRLNRDVNPVLVAQCIDGVEVRCWRDLAQAEPAEIVVEGFGVRPPPEYVDAMVRRKTPPVWINLEYLSAEKWVEGCHVLPSPQPANPLVKYFFFPGFTPVTGGLLMERGLCGARDAFQRDTTAITGFLQSLQVTMVDADAVLISLFCYDNAALSTLVHAWAGGAAPVVCIAPEGNVLTQLSQVAGRRIVAGSRVVMGKLAIHAVPFLELDQYDRLLWACDVNFVRGEDSFVRAQLAARPLVWQAYPQSDGAHMSKVDAFLDRYCAAAEPEVGRRVGTVFNSWNRQSTDMGRDWCALMERRADLDTHASHWASHLCNGGNLARRLAEFCEYRLK